MLLSTTDRGLYCEAGDFYIDPWQPVDRARHHARARRSRALGMRARTSARARASACCARGSAPARRFDAVDYGEPVDINGVRVSLHPAGHILGSAQVRVEHRGEVWVVSGDYKTEPDPTCTPFELVRCHTFITEIDLRAADLPLVARSARCSTRSARGGAPIATRDARRCCSATRSARRSACSPACADADIGPIYTHGAVERLNRDYRDAGVALADTTLRERAADAATTSRAVSIVAPPSAGG